MDAVVEAAHHCPPGPRFAAALEAHTTHPLLLQLRHAAEHAAGAPPRSPPLTASHTRPLHAAGVARSRLDHAMTATALANLHAASALHRHPPGRCPRAALLRALDPAHHPASWPSWAAGAAARGSSWLHPHGGSTEGLGAAAAAWRAATPHLHRHPDTATAALSAVGACAPTPPAPPPHAPRPPPTAFARWHAALPPTTAHTAAHHAAARDLHGHTGSGLAEHAGAAAAGVPWAAAALRTGRATGVPAVLWLDALFGALCMPAALRCPPALRAVVAAAAPRPSAACMARLWRHHHGCLAATPWPPHPANDPHPALQHAAAHAAAAAVCHNHHSPAGAAAGTVWGRAHLHALHAVPTPPTPPTPHVETLPAGSVWHGAAAALPPPAVVQRLWYLAADAEGAAAAVWGGLPAAYAAAALLAVAARWHAALDPPAAAALHAGPPLHPASRRRHTAPPPTCPPPAVTAAALEALQAELLAPHAAAAAEQLEAGAAPHPLLHAGGPM